MEALRAECVQLDPHPVVHEAGLALLSRIGISLVAATTSSGAALRAVSLQHPELFVLEPLLPETDAIGGLECIRRSLRADPGLIVIALSAGAEADWHPAVLTAGAAAFVPKSAPVPVIEEAILDALERACSGDEMLLSGLTPREREILALVAEHRTNAEVARMLWLSRDTVKFHLANVYRKVGVSSRAEAARWARRHGLTERPLQAAPQPPTWPLQPFAWRRASKRERGTAPSRADSVRWPERRPPRGRRASMRRD